MLSRFGIALRDSYNEFRSMEDVIDDVASMWDKLGTVEQGQIATAIAGTYQRNTFIATMENYDKVLRYTNESLNAAGTAEEKYGVVLESLQGKINQLISMWEKFVNNLNQSGTFADIIEAGEVLINVLDILFNKLNAFKLVVVPVTIISGLKLLIDKFKELSNFTTDAYNSIKNFGSTINNITSIGSDIIKAIILSKKYTKEKLIEMAVTGQLSAKMFGLILRMKGYNAESIEAIGISNRLSRSFTAEAMSASMLENSMGKANGAMSKFINLLNNPKFLKAGVILAVVSAFLSLGVAIYKSYYSLEALQKKTEEANNKYKETQSELEEINNKLEENKRRIEELESLPTLTFVEKNELDNLEEANKKLEEQKKLYETLAELRYNEYLNAKTDELNKEGFVTEDTIGASKIEQNNLPLIGSSIQYTFDENDVNDQVARYKKLQESIKETTEKRDELAKKLSENPDDKNTQKKFDEANKLLENYQQQAIGAEAEIRDKMLETKKLIDEYSAIGEENLSKENLEVLNYLKEQYAILESELNNTLTDVQKKKFDEIIDTSGIKEELDGVNQLFDEGIISIETRDNLIKQMFEDIRTNDKLKSQLISEGIFTEEDFKRANDFYALMGKITNTDISIGVEDNTTKNVSEVYASLEDVDKSLAEANNNIEKFNELNKNIENGNIEDYKDELSDLGFELENIDFSSTANAIKSMNDQIENRGDIKALENNIANMTEMLQDSEARLEEYTGALETFESVIGQVASGEQLAGDELFDFLKQVENLSAVYNSATGEMISAQSVLVEYIRETGDLTFNNGRIITELYGTFMMASEDEIKAQMELNKKIAESGIRIEELKIKIWSFALSAIQSIGNVGRALAEVFDIDLDALASIVEGQIAGSELKIMEYQKNLETALGNSEVQLLGLDAQFSEFGNTASNAMKSAADAARELSEELGKDKDNIQSLLDAVMDMLKQEKEDEKKRYEDKIKELDELFKIEKEHIDDLKDRENDRYEERKKQLEAEADAIQDAYDKQKEALENELEAYQEKINSELEFLRLKEEERKYDKELAEKQNDIAKIQDQLTALEFDNSIEAQKKKLELAQELAEKQEELDEFQHDRDISLQEDALQNELDRFEQAQKDKIEGIEKEAEEQERLHESKLEHLELEHEAYLNNLDARLEAAEAEYEAEKQIWEDKIKKIEDFTSKEVNIRNEAIRLIEERSDELYQRLIAWNRDYGTHIDADVVQMWNKAYESLDKFAGEDGTIRVQNALEDITTQMNELEKKTDGVAESFKTASGYISDAAEALKDYNNESDNKEDGRIHSTYDRIMADKNKPKKSKPLVQEVPGLPGVYTFVPKSHTGEDFVKKTQSPFDKLLGLKPDETLRILKVGERVIPAEQNFQNLQPDDYEINKNISNNVSKISKGSKVVPNNDSGSVSVVMGDINIEGNADQTTIQALKKERESIIRGVFDRIEKHGRQSGFRNMKLFSI